MNDNSKSPPPHGSCPDATVVTAASFGSPHTTPGSDGAATLVGHARGSIMSTTAHLTESERRFRRALRQRAYVKQHGKCYWCGRAMVLGDRANPLACTTSHRISRRGGNIVVAACLECNQLRSWRQRNWPRCVVYQVGNPAVESPFVVLLKRHPGGATDV